MEANLSLACIAPMLHASRVSNEVDNAWCLKKVQQHSCRALRIESRLQAFEHWLDQLLFSISVKRRWMLISHRLSAETLVRNFLGKAIELHTLLYVKHFHFYS